MLIAPPSGAPIDRLHRPRLSGEKCPDVRANAKPLPTNTITGKPLMQITLSDIFGRKNCRHHKNNRAVRLSGLHPYPRSVAKTDLDHIAVDGVEDIDVAHAASRECSVSRASISRVNASSSLFTAVVVAPFLSCLHREGVEGATFASAQITDMGTPAALARAYSLSTGSICSMLIN